MTMTMTTTERREEIAVSDLDQRFASMRLASPQEIGRLRSSIERMGMMSPVLVATAVEPARLVLVDGFKRVRIVTELGQRVVWATRCALDARAAKVAMVVANAPHRGLCDLEKAWVVRSLCREHKLTQAEVGGALRRDKSWVCRRLMLAERLESELQEEIRLGLLSSTMARELVRLPRGNQERMAKAIRAQELTSRQAHLVVTAVLGAKDPRARDEVLADPLRYLGVAKTAGTTAADPRLSVGGNEIRKSMLALVGVATRLWRSVEQHAAAGLVGEEARILVPLAVQGVRASRESAARLERLVADSGMKP